MSDGLTDTAWAGKGSRVPRPASPSWISSALGQEIYVDNKLNGVLWPLRVGTGFYNDMRKSTDWNVVNNPLHEDRFIHRPQRPASKSTMIWVLIASSRYDTEFYADAEAAWDADLADCQAEYDDLDTNMIYVHVTPVWLQYAFPHDGWTTKRIIPPSRTPPSWMNVEYGNWKDENLVWTTDLYDYYDGFALRRQYMDKEIVRVLSGIENKVHPARIYFAGSLSDWFYAQDDLLNLILPPVRDDFFIRNLEYEMVWQAIDYYMRIEDVTNQDYLKSIRHIMRLEKWIQNNDEPPNPDW